MGAPRLRLVEAARDELLRQLCCDGYDLGVVRPRLEQRLHEIIHEREILSYAVDDVVEDRVNAPQHGIERKIGGGNRDSGRR